MAKPQVTLTFAGDSQKLEDAFDRVGTAARSMGTDVSQASDSFDRVAESSDTVDTRAMGFRDTLTGIQDGFEGIKKINEGDLGFESLLLLGFGVGDLASGLTNFLVPAVKSAVGWFRAMNLTLLTSPITWIVIGIVALVAVIVLIATKTDWFQKLWKAIWDKIGDPVKAAWDWIKKMSGKVLDWFLDIPSMTKKAFSKLTDIITWPYRTAFNTIADAWNATIGKLSWTVPDWIPKIGGMTISAPKLPKFHQGGVVPGAPGQEMLAVLQAGERVTPAGRSGGATVLEVHSGGSRLDDVLVEVLARAVRVRGGNVQLVLGSGRG